MMNAMAPRRHGQGSLSDAQPKDGGLRQGRRMPHQWPFAFLHECGRHICGIQELARLHDLARASSLRALQPHGAKGAVLCPRFLTRP